MKGGAGPLPLPATHSMSWMGGREGEQAGTAASTAIVTAARACIGVRFRPQGRDPDFGLDCVGLVAVALRAGGFTGGVPAGYAMRSGDPARVSAAIDAAGLVRVEDAGSDIGAGDLLLCASGPGQLHLAIRTENGIVHADGGLGRVVERPGTVGWPVIGIWRLE